MLKVPLESLHWVERKYFMKAKKKKEVDGPIQVTVKNITKDEFEFITSQENQKKWAYLSIAKRCILFHR